MCIDLETIGFAVIDKSMNYEVKVDGGAVPYATTRQSSSGLRKLSFNACLTLLGRCIGAR